MIVKLKPLSWFKENAFEDKEGDFWSANDKGTNEYYVPKTFVNTVLFNVTPQGYEAFRWAVDKILTKEDYPEYFV